MSSNQPKGLLHLTCPPLQSGQIHHNAPTAHDFWRRGISPLQMPSADDGKPRSTGKIHKSHARKADQIGFILKNMLLFEKMVTLNTVVLMCFLMKH